MFPDYDIIVVGGGHAGCEAAMVAGNMGCSVLLVTMNLQLLGAMSCNPAMGGIAKGQIVREIDALGGYSGLVSDASTIQFRMLNRSKGPGMWSPRTQNDRSLFSSEWRLALESNTNVSFWQDSVTGLIVSRGTISGVKTGMGAEIKGKTVILTNGTFLNGIIHIGQKQSTGGRIGEKASIGITEQLIELGFETARLKTGTPPRVDGRTLNYSKMERQDGDTEVTGFSFLENKKIPPETQLPCWIAYTSTKVHETLKKGFHESPIYSGNISGSGPRYCPSIEDKISRFSEKDSHQLFIEPEGRGTIEIYVNGFSTSLPDHIQYEALKKIAGFEQVKMFRPGYAIEYDFFPPTQLRTNLETKLIQGLFFAGQINGTTGYEEAACQGLMAGINASQYIGEKEPFILKRDEAYIGVLIDDLVNKGTDEPYRMFTSRAEYRTLLRQDNADLRLTPLGYQLGIATENRQELMKQKEESVASILRIVSQIGIEPGEINSLLESRGEALLKERTKLIKLVLRPHLNLAILIKGLPKLQEALKRYSEIELEQAEIQIKYETYIHKERELANKMTALEDQVIPESFNYQQIGALGTEAKQKLTNIRPRTLGQATRISGINPTDIQILMVMMGR